MSSVKQARRRGGQPGNQNARGNRGNPSPRPNFGNRGGAPRGNLNAAKKPQTLHAALLKDYRNLPEAEAWIRANADRLGTVSAPEGVHDRALYDGARGLTPPLIAAKGLEFRLGLYTSSTIDADPDTAA